MWAAGWTVPSLQTRLLSRSKRLLLAPRDGPWHQGRWLPSPSPLKAKHSPPLRSLREA